VALAAGERMDSSGRDVLAAIVLGYEIARRLPACDDGWDSTTGATLVGAVMAGWLMRLPEDRLADAFALSVVHCNILSIVRRGQLSAAKSLSGAIASQTAVTSVLLAAEGVTGPPTALEESARAIRSGADQAGLTAPLGGDFGIMEVGLKAHPCIGTMQTAVEAALRVRSKLRDPGGEIERIEVRMADTPFVTRQVVDAERQNPTTRETADHSFPFLAAVALLDGELTVHSFEDERWHDPAVRALMQRTTLETDVALNKYLPGAWPAAVRVITKAGGDYLEEVPLHPGHTKNFMTPAQVQAKFHRFSADAVPQAQRDAIVAEATGLERAPSIRTLMKLVGRTS
jgi:2-methylcitrate dehydratase